LKEAVVRILLVYPEFPDTFWSFKHALGFIRRRSAFPPLGLLTVAAMLPAAWEKRLVDCNVRSLTDADLVWADMVFLSAMAVQRKGAREIIARCKEAGVKLVAGGPLFTAEPSLFEEVDHLVLGEAEVTLPPFLVDLGRGHVEHTYVSAEFARMADSPVPLWDLLDLSKYATMSVQFGRGCPFDCEFCNVTALLGHRPRTKAVDQVIDELEVLCRRGYRGGVFFVDDNFIGNKKCLKTQLLPALVRWRTKHPTVTFHTEASINLADDPELMDMMVAAGFDMVFVGIETTNQASLVECSKKHNVGRNMIEDVRRLHRAGLQVQGGFIVGFDSDGPGTFERMRAFIQEAPIVTAMVGLLQALPGTRLHARMMKEGRLTDAFTSGDNVDGKTNIIPTPHAQPLDGEYGSFLRDLYSPKVYYRRVRRFLSEYRLPTIGAPSLRWREQLRAVTRSVALLGVIGRERLEFWKLLLWTLVRRPRAFPLAITFAIWGYHFRRTVELRLV
jgi:radical SAM superfamily enzyme YgiQ (UPF0313 family)